MGRPDARLECTKDLEDFMLFIGTGMKGKKGDDYYFKRRNRMDKGRDQKETTHRGLQFSPERLE
jgi:hypothetical protein